ncbi:MAG: Y-family DNA polymerase [Bacteroidetes bacterium]|nr:Y-family DNA polymerase [Bacteroidota bacterium]
MVGLCDCNNFFVSCERVFAPQYNNRPTIVLSSNDGCIIARSNEAKALGLKMGQPLYQVKNIIKRYDIKIFSSNYFLYGDMSNRIMATLRSNVPEIEVYSIDEAFLNFDGYETSKLQEYGLKLSSIVKKNTGVPVSLGIAPTKTLAKIASKLCKKYPKLNGCCLMYRSEDIEKVLKRYPIEDVWGIGRAYSRKLLALEIVTAYDFVSLPAEWVKRNMSIVGFRIWQELKGVPAVKFDNSSPDKQSICVSKSFSKEIEKVEELGSAISTFVTSACEKLRKQKSCCSQLQIFIYTNRHKITALQHSESRVVMFDIQTDSTIEIAQKANEILKSIFKKGYAYKKAGVVLSHISPKLRVQGDLFDKIDRNKHTRLMGVIDSLNSDLGRNKVSLASNTDIFNISSSEFRSDEYTTKWEDILRVKV